MVDEDETTLRPENNQEFVSTLTSFTAGKAVAATGKVFDAFLGSSMGELGDVAEACADADHHEGHEAHEGSTASTAALGIVFDPSEDSSLRVRILRTREPIVAQSACIRVHQRFKLRGSRQEDRGFARMENAGASCGRR